MFIFFFSNTNNKSQKVCSRLFGRLTKYSHTIRKKPFHSPSRIMSGGMLLPILCRHCFFKDNKIMLSVWERISF